MRALRQKAGSQRGASITFALLLFLVCAVISSVVIVAATAAAGRMSDQSEMDERYYAVAATAKCLNEIYNGKEIKIKYAIDNGKTTITSTQYLDGSTTPDIIKQASEDVFKQVLLKETVAKPTQIIISETPINCTVDREMGADGRLEYTISAQKTATESKPASGYYTVILSFSPNVSKSATDASAKTGSATVKWKLLGAKKVQATVQNQGS